MKISIKMKDPDVLEDAIREAVVETLGPELDQEERDALREIRVRKCLEVCKKWFEYEEYVTLVVDTDAGTCTVEER